MKPCSEDFIKLCPIQSIMPTLPKSRLRSIRRDTSAGIAPTARSARSKIRDWLVGSGILLIWQDLQNSGLLVPSQILRFQQPWLESSENLFVVCHDLPQSITDETFQVPKFFAYEQYGAKYEMMVRDLASTYKLLSTSQAFEKGIEVLSRTLDSVDNRDERSRKGMAFADLLIKVCCFSRNRFTTTDNHKANSTCMQISPSFRRSRKAHARCRRPGSICRGGEGVDSYERNGSRDQSSYR